jgi:Protein of unknown function (DUF4231)
MDAAFDALLQDLRKLVEDQVVPCYKWYSTHKEWPRVLFRVGGLVVVIGSLTLPAIANSRIEFRDLLLTVVSLAVAAFSSLNAFFRWDGAWRSRTRTAYDLQGKLARWEFGLKSAEFADDPRKAALEATEILFKEAFALVGSETDEFFSNVRWPEAPK